MINETTWNQAQHHPNAILTFTARPPSFFVSSSPSLKSSACWPTFVSLINGHQLNLKNQCCIGWNSGRAGVKEKMGTNAKKKARRNKIQHANTEAKEKDTWSQGHPSFHRPTPVQSPDALFRPCSSLKRPHPTVKAKVNRCHIEKPTEVWMHRAENVRTTYSSDDSAQANFEAQWFSLLLLSRCCRGKKNNDGLILRTVSSS